MNLVLSGFKHAGVLAGHVPAVLTVVECERWQLNYRHPQASVADHVAFSPEFAASAASGLVLFSMRHRR
jgi:hypothetical protein